MTWVVSILAVAGHQFFGIYSEIFLGGLVGYLCFQAGRGFFKESVFVGLIWLLLASGLDILSPGSGLRIGMVFSIKTPFVIHIVTALVGLMSFGLAAWIGHDFGKYWSRG